MARKSIEGKRDIALTLDESTIKRISELFPEKSKSYGVRKAIEILYSLKKTGIKVTGLNGDSNINEERFEHLVLPVNPKLCDEYVLSVNLTSGKFPRLINENEFIKNAQEKLGIMRSETVLEHIGHLTRQGFIKLHKSQDLLEVVLKPKAVEGAK